MSGSGNLCSGEDCHSRGGNNRGRSVGQGGRQTSWSGDRAVKEEEGKSALAVKIRRESDFQIDL